MPEGAFQNRPMTPREWALLVILSVLWGGSFYFVGIAVQELPPLTIVVLRVGIAALTLYAIMRIIGVRLPTTRAAWTAFLGMGLLNNAIPFALIVWGQTTLASGVASILNATTPFFAVIAAHLMTSDEKMTASRVAGVVVGFVGVTIMIGGSASQMLGVDMLAEVAILGAAVSYSLAGIYGRRFRDMGTAPLATATGQVTASTLLLLPVVLLVDQPWILPWPSMQTVGALLGLALLSTALAYILYFRILSTAGATNLLLVTFLVPVSAILLGVTLLHETLLTRHILGMALIGVGLAAVDGRAWNALFRSRAVAPPSNNGDGA